MSWKKTLQSLALSLIVAFSMPTLAFAACAAGQQSCTSTYAVGEAFFGSGGNLSSCSTSYCSKQAAGELGVGNTKSTNYQAQAGFNTDRQPYLQMVVNTTSLNMGVLSSSSTSAATATFLVKTYLASGYVVTNAAAGPSNGSHTMSSPGSPVAAAAGTEQFGMNLVANNACAGLAGSGISGGTITGSSDPVQVPSSTFSFGAAAAGYNTPCQFKYGNGDTVAQSSKSSGETDYTISYIFNISSTTPGGLYTMQHVLVATSTY